MNPKYLISLARYCLQLAPEVLSPYKTQEIIAGFVMYSCPNNSAPHLTWARSQHLVLRNTLLIPAERSSRLFNVDIKDIKLTLSLNTTVENMVNASTFLFLCLPVKRRTFLIMSNFTSNILWHSISLEPPGRRSHSSNNQKAILAFSISFSIAGFHSLIPFSTFSKQAHLQYLTLWYIWQLLWG